MFAFSWLDNSFIATNTKLHTFVIFWNINFDVFKQMREWVDFKSLNFLNKNLRYLDLK